MSQWPWWLSCGEEKSLFRRLPSRATAACFLPQPVGMRLVCVCVINYLYPATCSLKGYGSGGGLF